MSNKHYIITNRPVIEKDGREIIDDSGDVLPSTNLRFARYDVESEEIEVIPDIFVDAETAKINYNASDFQGSVTFFKEIYQAMRGSDESNDLLFFVHGFKNNVNDVVDNIQKLHKHYVQNEESPIETIVAFAWTSNKRFLRFDYRSDSDDAEIAGLALSRAFMKFNQFLEEYFIPSREEGTITWTNEPCQNNIHLMCHSMGNQVLQTMMRGLYNKGYLATKSNMSTFSEIILIASDVDNDIFENGKEFTHLTEIGDRVHIYTSRKDRVLKVSSSLLNDKRRLGLGTHSPVYLENVFFVEVSTTTKNDKQGLKDEAGQHWYHYTSKDVIADINQVLETKDLEDITNRKQGKNPNYFIIKK